MARPKNDNLREFILRHVEAHGAGIAAFAAREFGVTRASVNLYLKDLVAQGLLEAAGATKARRYQLKTLDRIMAGIDLRQAQAQERLWQDRFSAPLAGLPENVQRICEAGFGAIMDNAIRHCEGQSALVLIKRNYAKAVLRIADDGVGIFDRIARARGFSDRCEAVLELAKGRPAADGEGIFFTARMFDTFTIRSGGLRFTARRAPDGEVLLDVMQEDQGRKGTSVEMEIRTDAPQTIGQAFRRDADRDTAMRVPLRLAQLGGEYLMSRAAARRVMRGCESCAEVRLDFTGVDGIGPQFADEIFRVWAGAHAHVRLQAAHACGDVEGMIRHARVRADLPAAASARAA